MSIQNVIRADNWWLSKIPPLLAVGYAEILLLEVPPAPALTLLFVAIASICGVASYGHVINDAFDIVADLRAGKKNFMVGYSPLAQWLMALFCIAIGFLPLLLLENPGPPAAVLALNYLLPTIYSIPPVRTKERGVLGVLCDTSGVHAVPTLFFATCFLANQPANNAAWVFSGLAFLWAFVFGLKGILIHQLLDRETDAAAGVTTFGVGSAPLRTIQVVTRFLYWIETGLFLAVLGSLFPSAPGATLAFVAFAAIELGKGLLGWKIAYGAGRRYLVANLPLVDNRFYELWFPVALAAHVAWAEPALAWLVVLQVVLFWPNLRTEARNLRLFLESARESRRNRKNLREWDAIVECWPGNRARLMAATRPGGARITLERVDGEPFHVKFVKGPLPLRAGEAKTVRFSAKADRPRSVEFGVGQFEEPWGGLGIHQRVDLSAEWQSFEDDFLVAGDEPKACFYLWLGGDDAAVEFAEWSIEPSASSGPWILDVEGDARAQRIAASPGELRIDVLSTDGGADHVKIARPGQSVNAGSIYRAAFRARADRPRRLVFGLCQTNDPWEELGLQEEVQVGPEWRGFEADFAATRDESAASLYVWLGEEAGTVEIADLSLAENPSGPAYFLDRADTCLAYRPASNDETLRVAIVKTDGIAWNVKLRCEPLAVQAGEWYRAHWLARADQSRPVGVGFAQHQPPWSNLGFAAEIDVDEQWREFREDFRIPRAENEASLYFWLGEAAGAVELSGAAVRRIEARDDGPWSLQRYDRCKGQVRPLERGVRVDGLVVDGYEDHLRLVRGRITLAQGNWYRVEFRARADRARLIPFGIGELSPPFDDLGLHGALPLADASRGFRYEFEASQSCGDACFYLLLGETDAAVAVEDFSLTPIEAADGWALEVVAPAEAYRRAAAGASIVLHRSDYEPAHVKLSRRGVRVRKGGAYRARFRAKADRDRSIHVGVCQSREPWADLGFSETFRIGLVDEEYFADFLAADDDDEAMLYFWLGGAAGEVEIGDASVDAHPSGRPWLLERHEGCLARRVPTESEERIALRIDKTDGVPWHVKLSGPSVAVEAGRWYRLRFRAKSDAIRPLSVGVGQSVPPWDDLGLTATFDLRKESAEFFEDFQATASESAASVYFWLGASAGFVEFEDVALEPMPSGEGPWSLARAEDCRAHASPIPGGVRVAGIRGDAFADHVKLMRGDFSVTKDDWYTLRFRARGDRSRPLTIGVGQRKTPWDDLGLHQALELSTEWQDYLADFAPGKDEENACFYAWLGEDASAVEIADWSLEVGRGGNGPWLLETSPASRARRLPAERGASVEIARAEGKPSDVKLTRVGLSVESARAYRLRFEAKASQARDLHVLLSQAADPWGPLGLSETLRIGASRGRYVADFVATGTEPNASLAFWMGDEAGTVEISEVELEPIELASAWTITSQEGSIVQRTDDGAGGPIGVSVIECANEPWSVKLNAPPVAVVKGQWYRLDFRARASESAVLGVDLSLPHEPWTNLGLTQSIGLGPEWDDYTADFVAIDDVALASVSFWLGGFRGGVEIDRFHMRSGEELEGPWSLDASPPAAARMRLREELVRVESIQTSDDRFALSLSRGMVLVSAGARYRIAARVRADRRRPFVLAVSIPHEPWTNLGLYEEHQADPSGTDVAAEFVATESADDARIQFVLGADDAPFEVMGARIEEVPPLPAAPAAKEVKEEPTHGSNGCGWRLSEHAGASATLDVVPDDPKRLRVAVTEPGAGQPWNIQLERGPFGVLDHGEYRLRFDARAEAPRKLYCSVSKLHEPWTNLGLYGEVELTPAWSSHEMVFEAKADEPVARLHFDLGGGTAPVELANVELEPAEPWELLLHKGAAAEMGHPEGRRDRLYVTIHSTGSSETWGIQLKRRLRTRAGARYRFHCRARAAAPRELIVAVSQDHEPWKNLGLFHSASIGGEWADVTADFEAREDQDAARICFQLGGSSADVELENVGIEPLPPTP